MDPAQQAVWNAVWSSVLVSAQQSGAAPSSIAPEWPLWKWIALAAFLIEIVVVAIWVWYSERKTRRHVEAIRAKQEAERAAATIRYHEQTDWLRRFEDRHGSYPGHRPPPPPASPNYITKCSRPPRVLLGHDTSWK